MSGLDHLFSGLRIAASGMSAERLRADVIAENIANARTTRTEEGGPYRRQDPVFEAVPVDRTQANDPAAQHARLVRVAEIRTDPSDPRRMFDPSHPDADEAGYVELPNVDVVEEMVNMITASRAYEAGVTLMQTVKGMGDAALSIGA